MSPARGRPGAAAGGRAGSRAGSRSSAGSGSRGAARAGRRPDTGAPAVAPSEDILRLAGIQAYGHLGVTQKERDLGQRVEADIELAYPPPAERRADMLDSVVDYEEVHRVVRAQIGMSRCRLLETLAEELALALLAEFDVTCVRIRLRKLHVPVAGFTVSPEVEIERRRP
jgi:dihydroneopterin aldolase